VDGFGIGQKALENAGFRGLFLIPFCGLVAHPILSANRTSPIKITVEPTFSALMQADELIHTLTTRFPVNMRAKLRQDEIPSEWGLFLLSDPGYVESPTYGPVATRELEWIEFDPLEHRSIGRLMPLQIIDHTLAILQQLAAERIVAELTRCCIRILL
jgi:hypothetical protein